MGCKRGPVCYRRDLRWQVCFTGEGGCFFVSRTAAGSLWLSPFRTGCPFPCREEMIVLADDEDITWGEVESMGNKLLAKISKKSNAAKPLKSPLSAEFVKRHPYLSAFLSETVDADDEPRKTSRIAVYIDGGRIGASLSDPTNKKSVYVTLSEPGAVWSVLEAALAADDTDWRDWKDGDSGQAKKKS